MKTTNKLPKKDCGNGHSKNTIFTGKAKKRRELLILQPWKGLSLKGGGKAPIKLCVVGGIENELKKVL